jgi:mRNA-degrading endonuclease RelE of RelBE toxin-antitoxin system
MARRLNRFRVSDHAAVVFRTLHLKSASSSGIQTITADPFAGKALTEELSGKKLRVSRFRVIYRIGQDKMIEIVWSAPDTHTKRRASLFKTGK